MKKWQKFSKEELEEIVKSSRTKKECNIKMGYSETSTAAREMIKFYNFDISHFGVYTDITGQKFGRLTALEYCKEETQKKGSESAIWKCQCDCGKITYVPFNNLTANHTQSCGCLLKEKRGKNLRLDLKGQRFGKLLVLDIDEQKTKQFKRVYHYCLCDCGNKISVSTTNLTKENGTKSCGCEKSKGELKVLQLLSNLKINFISQWTCPELKSEKPLRCDFAIFKDRKLTHIIEYNGEQHYETISHFGGDKRFSKQKIRDQIKKDFCQKNNIKLIEIPYWDYDKLNEDYLQSLF